MWRAMSGYFDFFKASVDAITSGLYGLLIPSVIFFLLCFLVKGREAVDAIKVCFSDGMFNICLMIFNLVLLTPVFVVLSGQVITNYFSQVSSSWITGLSPILVVLLAVFFGDFVAYWRHRIEHTRWLWPSHLIHHSDSSVSWLTLERFHPINRLTTFLIDGGVLVFLGFPPYAIIANGIIRHYYGYFLHADLPWTYGVWGKIFVSPAMHRWHHALDESFYGANFASIFSIFDRCFGTYKVPGVCDRPLGCFIKGGDNRFLVQLLYPFKSSSYQSEKHQSA